MMEPRAIVFFVAACAHFSCAESTALPSVCHGDLETGTVIDLVEKLPWTTEGLTFGDNGVLYVTALGSSDDPDRILALGADGSYADVGTLPSALGLAWDAGKLLVAGIDTGELYRFDPTTGDYEVIAQNLGAANFVVTAPNGNYLVADDLFDVNRISEVTSLGETRVWTADVPSPNGMAFSPNGATLYVAATFESEGLYAVALDADGNAESVEKLADLPAGSTPDGIAIDVAGNIYVALNLRGDIVKVTPAGAQITVATGLRGAASLAFGKGEFDPCSLYVSNLLGKNIWRVVLGDAH